MANSSTHGVTGQSIVGSAAFRKGYEDAKKGLPLAADDFSVTNAWHYERGRLFAFCYNGRLKNGRKVRMDALLAFQQAYNAGHVI